MSSKLVFNENLINFYAFPRVAESVLLTFLRFIPLCSGERAASQKARRDEDRSTGQFGVGVAGGAKGAPFRWHNPRGRRVFLKEKPAGVG